jgi:hypothetical protein
MKSGLVLLLHPSAIFEDIETDALYICDINPYNPDLGNV